MPLREVVVRVAICHLLEDEAFDRTDSWVQGAPFTHLGFRDLALF